MTTLDYFQIFLFIALIIGLTPVLGTLYVQSFYRRKTFDAPGFWLA